eukprot:PITA_20222
MAKDGRFRVEKFNGQNYQLWKMQMEDYLYQRDLYLPLSGKTKKSTSVTYKEWNILDRKALGTIRLKETTTEGLMSTLAKLYEKPSTSNKRGNATESSGETLGNSLTAETRGRKMERGKSPRYRIKSRKGRSKSRSRIVCWKCGKKGHLKKDCKSRKGK